MMSSIRRCREREPADSRRDKFNVIGGWLPSLTITFGVVLMKLVDHQKFGKLRLRRFCPKDDLYDECHDEHGLFVIEEIRGAVFARLRKRRKELVIIDLSLNDYSTNVAPAVFSAIGLDLEPGLSAKEVVRRFGKRPRWKRKDGGYVIFNTDGDFRYEVSCAYTDDDKLCQVRVRRLDIEIPDEH
jgi:hypothetical protein